MSIPIFFLLLSIGAILTGVPVICAIYATLQALYRKLRGVAMSPRIAPFIERVLAHIYKYADIWMLVGSFLLGVGMLTYALTTFQKL